MKDCTPGCQVRPFCGCFPEDREPPNASRDLLDELEREPRVVPELLALIRRVRERKDDA